MSYIRKPLNKVIKSGQSLVVEDTDKEVIVYETILTLGGAHDTVTFDINNGEETLTLTLPGGVDLRMSVKGISNVVTSDAAAGLLVRGFSQRMQIFGN
jgi:hypothetical protein